MANVLLMPLSGNIYFDHGAHQASTVPDLIHCGVSLGYDGWAKFLYLKYMIER